MSSSFCEQWLHNVHSHRDRLCTHHLICFVCFSIGNLLSLHFLCSLNYLITFLWNLDFPLTFFEISALSSRSFWNLYCLWTFTSEHLLPLPFFCWNLCFLFTFPFRILFSRHFSFDLSSFMFVKSFCATITLREATCPLFPRCIWFALTQKPSVQPLHSRNLQTATCNLHLLPTMLLCTQKHQRKTLHCTCFESDPPQHSISNH